jgi:cell division protein ZipA
MGLRELMILLLILAIVGVILRGLYVALRARRGQLRMALEKNIPQYDPDELISSELPNGGARLVQRSFEQVVKRNSEFTARDQAIPVLMDTLGDDEPLDEPPRASSVANARNAARQKHSQRSLKPVHRPIDHMAATSATPLAAGAAAAPGVMTDDENDARHNPAFEQDDEPRDSFSAAGYRDDDDRQDDDFDDADDYADDEDDYDDERNGPEHDRDGDDDWDDDDDDDDDRDFDDDQDDADDEDNDYDDVDDELAARGLASQRAAYDDVQDDDDDDDQDDYDDAEDELHESWEEDQHGEDDESEVEEFDQVYRDDADDDDVLLKPREGKGARAESWYEEELAPAAPPTQESRNGPRRWLQWAGEKLSGMGAAAAEKAVQEPERVQRAEPVLGLDTFDDDQVSAPRTVAAPTRAVREPLDKSRQKELSLDHPEDEILRERAREQKPARRQRNADRVRQDALREPAQVQRESAPVQQEERRSRSAAPAVEPAPKQRPAREEVSRQEVPSQQARAQTAEPPPEPAAQDFGEVLVLNVVARPDREITGVEMLQVLLANQLRFGDMAIFHRHMGADTATPVLFSVANLVNPGTFDLNRISEFSTRGLCFFMTLPSAASHNMQAFDQMLDAAQKVRIALDADLKDDNRSVMTAQTIEHYRQRVRDFDLRQLRQAK